MFATLPSRTAVTLMGFAVLSLVLLGVANKLTDKRIQISQQALLTEQLQALLPAGTTDYDPIAGRIMVTAAELDDNESVPIYRLFSMPDSDGKFSTNTTAMNTPNNAPKNASNTVPIAAVLSVTAPDGYNGSIKLLLGLRYDGEIIGARVVEHRETPGLGDDIDRKRSDWITRFDGLSLDRTADSAWAVKQDGGQFDAFTGATITPRAVIRAIHRAIHWYADNRAIVFAQ